MGLAYNVYLSSNRIYGCKNCRTHLSDHDDIISRVSSGSSHLCRASRSIVLFSIPSAFVIHLQVLTRESQSFRGQHGKAYLFNTVVNINLGEAAERNMTTGRHVVRDVNCRQCKETVGWKYDRAYEASEKYKEGKFILEAELLCSVT